MADEIWVDPEKLWALAGKINAESSNFAAAASGIGGLLNYLPDAVRSRLSSYVPALSELQLCVDAMSDLATFLQQKALAFAYLDGYDYFLMEGGGPSTTDAMSLDGSMFAGSMFAGSMFVDLLLNGMVDDDPRLGLINFLASAGIDITEGLYQAHDAGDWLRRTESFNAKWAKASFGQKYRFTWKYLDEYDKFGKGIGKVATVAGAAIDFGYMVTEDWDDYDGGEFATAVVVDAAEAAALAAAGYYGGVAGAAIGTMICPGVGTVIGGIAGSIIAGYAAGELADWFDESGYEADLVSGITDGAGWVADRIAGIPSIWDTTDDFYAEGAIQASSALSSAGDAIGDFCDSLWD